MGVAELWRDPLGRFTEHSTLKQHGILIPAAVEEVLFLKPLVYSRICLAA